MGWILRFQMDDFSGTILADCEELSKRQPSFTIPAIPNGTQYGSWSIKTVSYMYRVSWLGGPLLCYDAV